MKKYTINFFVDYNKCFQKNTYILNVNFILQYLLLIIVTNITIIVSLSFKIFCLLL